MECHFSNYRSNDMINVQIVRQRLKATKVLMIEDQSLQEIGELIKMLNIFEVVHSCLQ